MPLPLLLTVLTGYAYGARRALRERLGPPNDTGSTLEVVVIILGLVLLAGALIAVVTVAVNRRLEQIN